MACPDERSKEPRLRIRSNFSTAGSDSTCAFLPVPGWAVSPRFLGSDMSAAPRVINHFKKYAPNIKLIGYNEETSYLLPDLAITGRST